MTRKSDALEICPKNPHESKLEFKRIEDCDRQVLIDYYTFERWRYDRFGRDDDSTSQRWSPYAGGGMIAIGARKKGMASCDGKIRKLASGLELTRENFGWSVWSLPIVEYDKATK